MRIVRPSESDVRAALEREGIAAPDGASWSSAEPFLHVKSAVTWRDRHAARVPFRLEDGGPVINVVAVSPLTEDAHHVEVVLDTGGEFSIEMSSSMAERLDPWLSDELRHVGTSVFGRMEGYIGVLGAIRIDDAVAIAPVEAVVDSASERRCGAMLGLDALERLGGVIFDWPRAELILLPRRAAPDGPSDGCVSETERLRTDPRWVGVHWRSDPIRRTAATDRAHTEVIVGAMRWLWVTIDGREYRAVADTGSQGDMLSFVQLPWTGEAVRFTGHAHTKSGGMIEQEVAAPLQIGTLEFRRVVGARLVDPPRGGLPDHDLVLGIDILRRQPLWMDFETDTLRFWVGEDELPKLMVSPE